MSGPSSRAAPEPAAQTLPPFELRWPAARVVFGAGALARAGEALEGLGARRALVLTAPNHAGQGAALAGALGPLAAGVFAGARMHTPVEATEAAVAAMRAAGADATVALGGGSTTGLGKAVARRLGTKQLAIPTSYAGSEVTPILGETEGGRKTTVRDPALLPGAVIYDPDLTLGMAPRLTATSGLNALAHAAEALYARDRNPVASILAADGARAFAAALPRLAEAPRDAEARGFALYGAWLCGTVLGMVGMALHHKLAHALGGAFDLPHAELHAVLLPHAVGFNEAVAAAELRPLAEALGAPTAAQGLRALAARIGAPTALREIGMAEADIDRAAALAAADPYWNPRPVTGDALRRLLRAAWAGEPPAL